MWKAPSLSWQWSKTKKKKRNISIVTVYGLAHEENREAFLAEISQICTSNKNPMMLGSDFNILRFSSDKNKSFTENKASDLFNWVINTHELRELPLQGGKYTWSNNKKTLLWRSWTEFWSQKNGKNCSP